MYDIMRAIRQTCLLFEMLRALEPLDAQTLGLFDAA